MASSPFSIIVIVLLSISFLIPSSSQSDLCRISCGEIPIHFPFSIDDGCGSPYYRRLLFCSTATNTLHLRTPSGVYPVQNISYSTDSSPHLIVSDPSMFSSCNSTYSSAVTTSFALDASTHLKLSKRNTFLFVNCSSEAVIMEPKIDFCRTFPEQCEDGESSSIVCDSEGYLCSEIPRCGGKNELTFNSCCEYFPEASESIRVMLSHCDSYTSMYWKKVNGNEIGLEGVDEVPEYGIIVDFEIPMTGKCRRCNGDGGICGFDTNTTDFLCLCKQGNITTQCGDGSGIERTNSNTRFIVGTSAAVSAAGILGAGVVVWFIKKLKNNKVVACGVQSNENRLF